jgi:hypothetical protein
MDERTRPTNRRGSTPTPPGRTAPAATPMRTRPRAARGVARAAFLVVDLTLLSPAIAPAADPPEPLKSTFLMGAGVSAASGLGSMSTDLNGHPGFGIVVQGYVPVASRFELRPAFEWTGYRVNEYNLAALALVELLGGSYQDTRVVFRTYRLGLDGVAYFRERYVGPFVSGGVGVQLSQVYVEDVAHYSGGEEEVTPLHASSATTGVWLGGGLGYQWEASNVELRLSRAPYGFTGRRPANGRGNALPFEARPGWAVHLIVGARLPWS